jgi:hypothetical protein
MQYVIAQEADIYRKTPLFIKKSMVQNVMTMILGNIVIIKEFSHKKIGTNGTIMR